MPLHTVQSWADNGTLDAWKTAGGHRRITIASIELLATRLGKPPQPPEKPGLDTQSQLLVQTCTTRKAAALLGVSLRTVQSWVDKGTLDAWKTVGGHRRVTIASIEFLAAILAREGLVPPPP